MTMPARRPVPGMPLEALGPRVTARALNLLLRHGFTTVEQVATASDVELLEIRHMGESSVASIRDAIAALQAKVYSADATVVLTGVQVEELTTLLTTLAVYADARGRRDVTRLARTFLDETVAAGLRLADSATAGTPLTTRLRGPAISDYAADVARSAPPGRAGPQ